MDWNLKAPCWDFTEVDKANLPNNIETMDDSSRIGVFRTTQGDFSVDLKLGHVGNSGSESTKFKDAATASVGVSKMVSSSSGTSKRARAINNANLTVSCLVDGCNSDLRNCRDYHRRHKVCELHSKTPEVTIGGLKQRFCQQCSRFHSLDQFDERKRSCRKRLDGHNRRRRKPQPEPLTQPVGSFLSNYQGTQLLPFSSPHVYPSTAIVNNPTWSGGLVNSSSEYSRLQNQNRNQQLNIVDNKQDLFLGSSPTSSYKEGNKQLSFLHSDNHQNPPFHSVLRTNSLPVHDSPCALSLLSSSQTHTPGNSNLNQMVQPHHSMPNMQPLGLSLHDNDNTLLESVVPNESDHCSSMYNMGSDDGSQGNEGPQLFPFQWE